MPKAIKVLIVDDLKIFRQAMKALLETAEGITVVGEAGNGSEAIERAVELQPEVVLMDIMMPVMDGVAATRRIKMLLPAVEVVMLTMYQNESYQREAFAAGAKGYLLKDCGMEELVEAIRHAAVGDFYLCGAVGRDLVAEYIQPLLQSSIPGGIITQREKEIARLLADGYSTKEAAKVLNISPKTAETHRASIMKKLGAKNVADIVKYCIRNHIIEA